MSRTPENVHLGSRDGTRGGGKYFVTYSHGGREGEDNFLAYVWGGGGDFFNPSFLQCFYSKVIFHVL